MELGMKTNWIVKITNAIADLITRTKGLNDVHDDVGTHETSQATNRAVVVDVHDTDLPAVKTVVDGIQTDLSNATDGLGALKALIDAVQATSNTIEGYTDILDDATNGLANIKSLIDALQGTANTIEGYTDILDDATNGLANIKSLIDALIVYVDTEVAAILTDTGTTIPGTITTLQTAVTNIQNDLDNATDGLGALKALIDNLDADLVAHEASQATHRAVLVDIHDTDLPAVKTDTGNIKTQTDKIAGKMLFSLDFWSDPQEEVQVAAAAGTLAITPTVTVADLPAGATIVRAIAMFKFRMIENTYAGVNKLDGATVAATSQVIQVKETAAGAYIDAINFVDDQFTLADSAREGGDVLIGSIDITGQVDGNDSYTFQWLLANADQDFINFNDCQVGLRIWYSV